MKIIHTSDWHLGQKFINRGRAEEHQQALDWLRNTIVHEKAEVLVLAGDVFDVFNPPTEAQELYFNFLVQLIATPCRHVVVIGGNHDSPAVLEAPKQLLKALNIHVVGSASEDFEEELLKLKNDQGEIECIVAAVPFLRDRDLRVALTGEGVTDRVERIREGIKRHYELVAKKAERYKSLNVPIIATGHLFATGAQTAAKQDNIYVGDLENMDGNSFPSLFQYVALGHIHRAQRIGGLDHVRYSGSLIPLSFSEIKDEKVIHILNFNEGQLGEVKSIKVPAFRSLKTVSGTYEEVIAKMNAIIESTPNDVLTPWLDVKVISDKLIPNLDGELKSHYSEQPIEILKVRLEKKHAKTQLDEVSYIPELSEMEVEEVFLLKCNELGTPPDELEALLASFREIVEQLH